MRMIICTLMIRDLSTRKVLLQCWLDRRKMRNKFKWLSALKKLLLKFCSLKTKSRVSVRPAWSVSKWREIDDFFKSKNIYTLVINIFFSFVSLDDFDSQWLQEMDNDEWINSWRWKQRVCRKSRLWNLHIIVHIIKLF